MCEYLTGQEANPHYSSANTRNKKMRFSDKTKIMVQKIAKTFPNEKRNFTLKNLKT